MTHCRAWIQIRPLDDQPIRVICRHCGLDQPTPRWNDAIDQARAHNDTRQP